MYLDLLKYFIVCLKRFDVCLLEYFNRLVLGYPNNYIIKASNT